MLVFRGTWWNREDSESNTKLLKFVWICLLYILGSLQIVLPGIAGSMPCRGFGFPQFERFSSFKRWLDKPHSVGSEDAEIWIPDPRDRLATCRQSQFLGGWILCSSISFKPDLQPIQAQRTWIFRHKPGHQVLCRWLQYAMTINDQMQCTCGGFLKWYPNKSAIYRRVIRVAPFTETSMYNGPK